MSASKRHSSSAPSDLKLRVIACLNKLSDRDTLALATTELESIAKTLCPDSFSPFLACLFSTDSSEKSPVRKQCVRLLGLLSTAHGDALSPHLSKMLSTVLRRLRDPDSAVRSACVETVSSMASQITKPPFSSIRKPLVESIIIEQDYNMQIGASLCLAAAIDAAPDPEPIQLQKLLPRLLKLVKSDSFKAKPALLTLIGSIVGAHAVTTQNLLNCLISCLVEFLSCEDWAVRKAAAEVLAKLAMVQSNLLPAFRTSCLSSLENRRFDKVKVVRETMNRALELWKEVLPQSQSNSSSEDNGNGRCSTAGSAVSHDIDCESPQPKKIIPRRQSPAFINSLAGTSPIRSPPLKNSPKTPIAPVMHTLDSRNQTNWKFEISMHQPASYKDSYESDVKTKNVKGYSNFKSSLQHALQSRSTDDKPHGYSGLKFGSRIVPFHDELFATDCNATDEVYGSQKEIEDLFLIREQLIQIEHQQSNLLDTLQRFIGSSQSGMNSLENRVNGLEKALDEISHDLALSSGRISNSESAGNTCCMLRGAEFLSQKLWRRTEGQNPSSRISFSSRSQSLTDNMHKTTDKNASPESFMLNGPWDHHHGGSNLLQGNAQRDPITFELPSGRTKNKIIHELESKACNGSEVNGASFVNRVHQQT